MLSRMVASTAVARRAAACRVVPAARPTVLANSTICCSIILRSMTTVREAATIDDALKFSGYSAIDFTIPEDSMTYDAVQKFAAFNIGCLVTTDAAGAYHR